MFCRSALITFPMVGRALLGAVEYGAFLVQFLRWWEARGEAPGVSLPSPPPPQVSRCFLAAESSFSQNLLSVIMAYCLVNRTISN